MSLPLDQNRMKCHLLVPKVFQDIEVVDIRSFSTEVTLGINKIYLLT